MSTPHLRHLPRLERHHYQGFAVVHWTMKVEPSTPGWLDQPFHSAFREILLHACVREKLFCPTYCLMPDHLHLMWMGLSQESDQLNATKFLRLYVNRLLAGDSLQTRPQKDLSSGCARQSAVPWKLQPQAYDHVLREQERKQNAFAQVCFYILANPVRAKLAERGQDWPFTGCVVPGYPDLRPTQPDFWELFWKVYWQRREPTPNESPKAQ